MTTLTLLLAAGTVGLLVALVVTRRQMARMTGMPPEAPSPARLLEVVPPQPPTANRLAAAAGLAPLGIIVLDGAGDTIFENKAAADYTAATADDAVVGLRLRNLLAEAVAFDESIEQEIALFSPSPRTILLHAVPLYEDDERIGTAAFIDDLTTRSQIDSIRSDFIANASHELKTPLGAIRLLAEALVTTEKPDLKHDLAAKIQGETERMTRLVEDILDLALIEGSEPESETFDLCDVIDDALEQSRVLAETTGIEVRATCPSLLAGGDRRRLVSAVANLIENAINYTAAKGLPQHEPVEVRVKRVNNRALIEVEDHGIGISERHRDRVFERFYRVDRGRSRASGGTGLGLAIVRHVVQNLGGQVSVESVLGEGTTFRIEIPAAEV